MKERPILFSAPMVRALLAGTKTQTRRVMGKRAARLDPAWPFAVGPTHEKLLALCPYGQTGDRLWVREAFIHEPADYCWEASVSIPSRPASKVYRADHEGDSRGAGWKPSIHMPRALSRITLEVTGVRVERLQSISESDAEAEGVLPMYPDDVRGASHALAYSWLWDSINGAGSWAANPWVWVVEFRRV